MAGGSLVTKLRKGFAEFRLAGLVDEQVPRLYGAQATGCQPIARLVESRGNQIIPEVPQTIARSIAIGNPADGLTVAAALRETGGLAGLGQSEAFAFAVQDQVGVVDEGHAVGLGELLGADADEVDMGAFFEDQAGGLDRVAEALDAGYATGFHAAAVHEQGVKLDAAVGGEEAAAAGVEGGVVFEDGDGGFYGVGGGAAFFEDGVAGREGLGYAALVVFGHLRGDGPCAAVDD